MIYPKKLESIIEYYKKLPGIGEKSAERMALSTLDLTTEQIEDFSQSLVDAKNTLRPCKICGHITDKEICDVCSDESRDKNIICVLEDYKSVFTFEKAGNFKGVYHVLGGLISPSEGIGYEDINLPSLLDRIEKLEHPELILALKSNIEGETTTLFIKKILEKKDVVISRLSYGIPMGADIDYMDTVTLDKALDDRKQISE